MGGLILNQQAAKSKPVRAAPAVCQRTLPNGQQVWGFSKTETAILFHEIYLAESYTRHGVELRDGDTVFDIGANIGLFSIWLSQQRRGLKLFLFEPLPPVFEAMERNARDHLAAEQVILGNFGLSRAEGQATFELDPRFTFHSSMRRSDMQAAARDDADVFAWTAAAIADGVTLSLLPPRAAASWRAVMRSRALRPLAGAGLAGAFALDELRKRLTMQRFTCRLRTVSQVIREHSLERIDLLKIDVEGSEVDVLDGLQPEDWPRVRQMVVEVHDVRDRAHRLEEQLRQRGFTTRRALPDFEVPRLMGICSLHAVRR
jgi:FkbM family methyltransferase